MLRSNFGTVQYVSKGKYRVWWEAGRKGDGKRNRPSRIVYGTRDDADLFLAVKKINALGCDEFTTYDEFWAAKVEPSFSSGKLAIKTIEGYERVWFRELKPRIGRDRISSTTYSRAEEVLRSVGSAWVRRSAYQLWKKIMNMAAREGVRRDNPIDRYLRIDLPSSAERRLLDASEVMQWMEDIRGIKHEAVLLAESGGGLRHEEASPLLGENVTPITHRGRLYANVRVDKALVSTNHGRVLKGVKNGFSQRDVIIGAPFAERLLDLAACDGPLCPGGEQRPTDGRIEASCFASPSTITNNYRKWCERNGISYVNPGKLRKSWSTMHGEAGSPDSVVCLTMGHSDGTSRGGNYQKATRRGMILIADNLADLIYEESGLAHDGTSFSGKEPDAMLTHRVRPGVPWSQ